MRISRCCVVTLILAAVSLSGCGGGAPESKVEYKPADTSAFDGMKDQMTKNLKAGPAAKPAAR
jgi:hypothetical protein